MVGDLYDLWLELGNLSEPIRLCERLLERSDGAEPLPRARACFTLGVLYNSERRGAEAVAALESAHSEYQAIGLEGGVAGCLNSLGNAHKGLGDMVRARRCYEEAIEIWSRLDNASVVSAMMNLADLLRVEGELSASTKMFAEVLSRARKDSDRLREAHALSHLGINFFRMGDFEGARSHHGEALRLYRELDLKNGQANTLVNLANVHATEGDLETAVTHLRSALGIYEDLGDKSGQALALMNLGSGSYQESELDSARTYLEQALALARELDQVGDLPEILRTLGVISADQGDAARSAAYLLEALDLRVESGVRPEIARCFLSVCHASCRAGATREAGQLLGAARELIKQTESKLIRDEEEAAARLAQSIEEAIGADGFAEAMKTGAQLSLDDAAALARRLAPRS